MKNAILSIFCLIPFCLYATADDPVLNKAIDLKKSKGSIYEMLNIISEASGMLFIYDGKTIDNNHKAKIESGRTTLKQAILDVTKKPDLGMKVVGNHILLYIELPLQSQKTVIPAKPDSINASYWSIEGTVKDKETREPLPYASVSVYENGIGTVANQNGEFLLKVPDSLTNLTVSVSYVGYETQEIPVSLLFETRTDIYLGMKVIPIQEVIVNIANPLKIVKDMLENRKKNYPEDPSYLTTFYREGIDRKNGFVNFTEAVFKIYKTPFDSPTSDRVKLLKMRRIVNEKETDSISMKMKAGVEASLYLDLVKNLPDFLVIDEESPYNYTKIDMTVIDSRMAHIITFEQKPGIKAPLYKGELYIDAENSALLSTRFEINPEYIKKAKNMLVLKQAKSLDIIPKEASYTVSYKEWNGKYYLYYLRGDVSFTIKKKGRIFSRASTISTYFEMVSCKIDVQNVKPFSTKETILPSKIFSETRFQYDPDFWENFNTILPEQKLSEEISRISSKIEESFE